MPMSRHRDLGVALYQPLLGGRVGLVDRAREENKARAVVEIYRYPLGLHPFDTEDRYKEFIASGHPLAKALAECWVHMRTETGALAGSVMPLDSPQPRTSRNTTRENLSCSNSARAPACASGTQGSRGAWRCSHTTNPSEKRLTWTSRPTSLSPSLMHDSSARA